MKSRNTGWSGWRTIFSWTSCAAGRMSAMPMPVQKPTPLERTALASPSPPPSLPGSRSRHTGRRTSRIACFSGKSSPPKASRSKPRPRPQGPPVCALGMSWMRRGIWPAAWVEPLRQGRVSINLFVGTDVHQHEHLVPGLRIILFGEHNPAVVVCRTGMPGSQSSACLGGPLLPPVSSFSYSHSEPKRIDV